MIIFVNSTKNTTEIKAANTAKNLNEAIEQTCFFFSCPLVFTQRLELNWVNSLCTSREGFAVVYSYYLSGLEELTL